jgi:tetratricopeptide (TPR) repeat protein
MKKVLFLIALALPAFALPPQAIADPQLDGWDRQSRELSSQHKYAEALECCTRVLELDPNNFRAQQRAGWLCNETGHYLPALAHLLSAVALAPESASNWTELGITYFHLQRADECLDAFEHALKLNPESSTAWFGEGDLYCELRKNSKKAIAAYRQGLQAEPDNASANYHLGWCLDETRKFRQAVPFLKLAVDHDPDLANAWSELGYAYYETRDFKRCQSACQTALALNPKSVNGHFFLGLALVKTGSRHRAREQASQLKPLDRSLSAELKAAASGK